MITGSDEGLLSCGLQDMLQYLCGVVQAMRHLRQGRRGDSAEPRRCAFTAMCTCLILDQAPVILEAVELKHRSQELHFRANGVAILTRTPCIVIRLTQWREPRGSLLLTLTTIIAFRGVLRSCVFFAFAIYGLLGFPHGWLINGRLIDLPPLLSTVCHHIPRRVHSFAN
jgi:hypothetical protein